MSQLSDVTSCVDILENFSRGPTLLVFHLHNSANRCRKSLCAASFLLRISSLSNVSLHPTLAKNKVSTNKTYWRNAQIRLQDIQLSLYLHFNRNSDEGGLLSVTLSLCIRKAVGLTNAIGTLTDTSPVHSNRVCHTVCKGRSSATFD